MIEFKNVNKWYGDFQVLKDCSALVQKGEVVVVCGPSGSGKSTLIKCANGLESFQSGDILVNQTSLKDPSTDLTRLRSQIGMVFQNFELFPHLTVTKNLTLGQEKVLKRSTEEATQVALTLLERVGLKEHADKVPASCLGGSSSVWRLLGHSVWTRLPCYLMNRPVPWIPRWSKRC